GVQQSLSRSGDRRRHGRRRLSAYRDGGPAADRCHEQRGARTRARLFRRHRHHRWSLRQRLGRERDGHAAQAGRRRADPPVSCDVRPPAVVDPARTHQDHVQAARRYGSWHASEGEQVKLFFAAVLAMAAAGVVAAQQPAFRSGVDLVSLNVTVMEGTHYVTDLEQKDFNVFEDGVKQDVTFFNKGNLPIALALLLDTSARMDTKLPTAQEAAIGFAKRLRPQHLAQVIDFDNRVTVLQQFTSSPQDLETAIRRTSAGGSTSLYNAVYIALKDLKKVVAKNTDEIRRQAIIVLSDGEDTSSLLPFEEVLD